MKGDLCGRRDLDHGSDAFFYL